jgi:hypothetical protein
MGQHAENSMLISVLPQKEYVPSVAFGHVGYNYICIPVPMLHELLPS